MKEAATLHVTTRAAWRAWLRKNHRTCKVIWFIYNKAHSGKPRVSYDEAVEEALCFGWIDSIVKSIDDERYMQKFTPRTNTGQWSPANLRRMRKLIAGRRMTKAGLAKIDPALLAAPPPKQSTGALRVPPYMKRALDANRKAREAFDALAPSYRRHYVGWITAAKKEETRLRRLAEAISLLEKGRALGMK
jgi:uncharacterized protein YdeI (YjbR/CyaY-like superfamily)